MNEEFRKKPKLGILDGEAGVNVRRPKKFSSINDEHTPHPFLQRGVQAPGYAAENEKASRLKQIIQSRKPHSTRLLLAFSTVIVLAIAVGTGAYFINKPGAQPAAKPGQFVQPTPEEISLTVYYPRNLPKGYAYNDDIKTIKKDVYYYSVKGPKDTIFHVTQQALPENFDFKAFRKKFLNPSSFDTAAGTVTAGEAGASTLASILTKKNTWIIINSTAPKSVNQVEAIARSLDL